MSIMYFTGNEKQGGALKIGDFCGGTGSWSKPYLDAGYDVHIIDLPQDIRLMKEERGFHGILAAPPCDHFARVGARWWKEKGDNAIQDGLSVVDACLRFIWLNRETLAWWALENPIGRLKDYLGEPVYKFDPWWFGDPWTKRTWLWGEFTPPQSTCSLRPELIGTPRRRDRTSKMSSSQKRERSMTPPGFAQAFFDANP